MPSASVPSGIASACGAMGAAWPVTMRAMPIPTISRARARNR